MDDNLKIMLKIMCYLVGFIICFVAFFGQNGIVILLIVGGTILSIPFIIIIPITFIHHHHFIFAQVLAITLFVLLFVKVIKKVHQFTYKIVIFTLFFNPIVCHHLWKNPYELVIILSLLLRVGEYFKGQINYIFDIILCANPLYKSITFLTQNRKGWYVWNIVIMLIVQIQTIQNENNTFFQKTFTPGTNLMWLLYAHMFQRYTLLYQMILFSVPFLSLYPLYHLKMPIQLKQSIMFFFAAFVTNSQTIVYLFGFVYFYIAMFPIISLKKLQNGFSIWPLLTLVISVVDIMFFTFYMILKEMWQSTHMTNFGYLFVTQVVFWIANAVYLSEGINLYFPQSKKKQKFSIKEYLKRKIKQL